MGMFTCIYVCVLQMCIAFRGPKRVLNLLGLELQAFVSHQRRCWEQSLSLCKSTQSP